MVSSVVKMLGEKMREPTLIDTIYWAACSTRDGCGVQISRHCDAGADIDQPGQGAVLPDQPQARGRRQDGQGIGLAYRLVSAAVRAADRRLLQRVDRNPANRFPVTPVEERK